MTSGSLACQGIGQQPAGMGERELGRKAGRMGSAWAEAARAARSGSAPRRCRPRAPAAPGLDRKHDLVPGLAAAIADPSGGRIMARAACGIRWNVGASDTVVSASGGPSQKSRAHG